MFKMTRDNQSLHGIPKSQSKLRCRPISVHSCGIQPVAVARGSHQPRPSTVITVLFLLLDVLDAKYLAQEMHSGLEAPIVFTDSKCDLSNHSQNSRMIQFIEASFSHRNASF